MRVPTLLVAPCLALLLTPGFPGVAHAAPEEEAPPSRAEIEARIEATRALAREARERIQKVREERLRDDAAWPERQAPPAQVEAQPGATSPVARMAIALRQMYAENARLSKRVEALEQELQARSAPAEEPRPKQGRRRRGRRGQRVEARLDRLEAKLDRLLEARAGERRPARAPSRSAVRSQVQPPVPPARARSPQGAATMQEIEQLLDRARERIRDLEKRAPSPRR